MALVAGCDIHHVVDGIHFSYSTNFTVQNCTIHHMRQSGVEEGYQSSSYNTVFENNIIYSQQKLVTADHGSGLALMAGSYKIRNNTIYDCGNSYGIGFYGIIPEGRMDIIIENNLLYDTHNMGLRLGNIGDGNITIRNNTFLCEITLNFIPEKNLSKFKFYNNVLAGALQSIPADSLFPYYDQISKGGNIIRKIRTAIDRYTENYPIAYFENGFFKDYTGRNFVPVSSSPAVGFAEPAQATVFDILGNARDGAPDAGCYEYLVENMIGRGAASGDMTQIQIDVAVDALGRWINIKSENKIDRVSVCDMAGNVIRDYNHGGYIDTHLAGAGIFIVTAESAGESVRKAFLHAPMFR